MKTELIYTDNTLFVYLEGKYNNKDINILKNKIVSITSSYHIKEIVIKLNLEEEVKQMKLYEVTNGYNGLSQLTCTIIADNKERAIELAREEYKRNAIDSYSYVPRYPKEYWENLTAHEICEDTSKEYVGGVSE